MFNVISGPSVGLAVGCNVTVESGVLLPMPSLLLLPVLISTLSPVLPFVPYLILLLNLLFVPEPEWIVASVLVHRPIIKSSTIFEALHQVCTVQAARESFTPSSVRAVIVFKVALDGVSSR